MLASEAQDPKLLAHYEGLIRKTAALYVDSCEEDYDDIVQLFRIKVWKALLHFEPKRVKKNAHLAGDKQRDRFVFACVLNQAKDLTKRVKRNWAYIEDIAPSESRSTGAHHGHDYGAADRFDSRYLKATEEQIFGVIQEGLPLIPSSLTDKERQVIALLYLDYNYGEISETAELPRKDVATLVRGIREKMADWRPTPITASALSPEPDPVPDTDSVLPLAA